MRIIDAHRVLCERCQFEVKLSPKNEYDPEHWNKHRKRCDKLSQEDIDLKIAARNTKVRPSSPSLLVEVRVLGR